MRLRTKLAATAIAALMTTTINLAATQLLAQEPQATGPYPLQVIELDQPTIEIQEQLASTKYYLLPLQTGQHTTINLKAGNARAVLFSPTGTTIANLNPDNRQIHFRATTSGLHQLAVTILGHTEISNIKLTIAASPTPDRFARLKLGRVRFTNGNLTKALTLAPYTIAELIIFPGQSRTSISITAPNANIAFLTQDNRPLKEGYQEITSNLPNPGQRYKVVVINDQPNQLDTTLTADLKP